MIDVINLSNTEHTGLDRDMENRNRKQVQISLSENQLAAIDKAAAENGMNRSEFIRYTFAQSIENFPNDLPAHGENLKKRAS